MQEPLISVIIPVYNIEEYISKCIDSVAGQTYRNIEIILVDDGSKDGSGQICDEYAKADNRIKVVHKQNGGLSSARNAGLDIAKGDYITFADGDDFIENTTYEENIKYLIADDTIDAVQYPTYFKYGTDEAYISNTPPQRIDGKEALWHAFMTSGYHCAVWDKIFRAGVFKEIRFPQGLTSEDIYIIPELFGTIRSAYISEKGCYYYNLRPGSITKNGISYKRVKDIVTVYAKIYRISKDIRPLRYLRTIYLIDIVNYCLYAKYNFKDENIEELFSVIEPCNAGLKDIIRYDIQKKEKLKLLLYKYMGIKAMTYILSFNK